MSQRSTLPWLFLLLYCAILFFFGLTGELWRTEGLRARIAAECFEAGEWAVPTLYGQPLFTKPPGMYSAIALVSTPLGEVTDWSARVPSALAATGLVLLFYWFFCRHFGAAGGLVAAVLLPMAPSWLDKAPSAEIDMLQVFWVGAGLLLFLRGLEAHESLSTGSTPWFVSALLCVAGGFLTKWTAPAFFYLTVIPLLWWRGNLRLLWGRGHLIAAGLAVAVCAGWVVVAAHRAGWDVLYQTVSLEALNHLSPAHQSKPYPWRDTLAMPFLILAANLPLSAFALLTLRPGFQAKWDDRQRLVLQALHCWTWPSLLFWSVIPGHAVRHAFPLAPGLAGLAALVWIDWLGLRVASGGRQSPVDHEFAASSVTTGGSPPRLALISLVVLWLVVKIAFVEVVVPQRLAGRETRATGELLTTLVPAGQTLHLVGVKDEGIMFYYGRPVRRLSETPQLTSLGEPLYCMLTESAWQSWPLASSAEIVARLKDQQGAPLVLVKVAGSSQ